MRERGVESNHGERGHKGRGGGWLHSGEKGGCV